MYGESDAAAALGIPSRRAAGPGAGLRVQGLERRRATPPRPRSRSSAARSARSASRRSTRRSSTTSRQVRPQVKLVDGETREIVWPAVELYEARVPRAPRDLILLVGTEPSMRWRTFTQGDRRARRGARHPAGRDARARCWPTSRTRGRCRSPGSPRTRRWSRGSGCSRSSLRGPDRDRRRPARRLPATRGLPSASLWAAVPALRRRGARTRRPRWRWCASSRASSASPSTRSELEEAAADYERQVNAGGPERPRRAGVRRAPRAGRRRRRPSDEPGPLPSGDTHRPRPAALPAPARRGPA